MLAEPNPPFKAGVIHYNELDKKNNTLPKNTKIPSHDDVMSELAKIRNNISGMQNARERQSSQVKEVKREFGVLRDRLGRLKKEQQQHLHAASADAANRRQRREEAANAEAEEAQKEKEVLSKSGVSNK